MRHVSGGWDDSRLLACHFNNRANAGMLKRYPQLDQTVKGPSTAVAQQTMPSPIAPMDRVSSQIPRVP
ncbi:Uncharacterized protein HZ326_23011 [Fusarium oxysporum f. sp. albedinis]|nr:Uncharacterized protein HZ326_23011 [Fusarium oxysporum f. sp. albedinis]